MLLDSSGNITDRYSYDAWGNLVEQVGTTFNPFRWNAAYGYEWTPATGLYHVGAREYDPRTTRWLQRDPIGVAGGHPNLYLYCLNNPVNIADPDGMFVPLLAGVGAGVVLGGIVGGVTAWVSGENIWHGGLRGAVIGAAGVLGGVAGASLAGTFGIGGTAGAVLGGALAGASSDLAVQGVSLAFAWQNCYRPCETIGAALIGGMGGVLGGVATSNGVRIGRYNFQWIDYQHTGGVGMNVYRDGKRIFALDWHKWQDTPPRYAPFWKWLHYHRRPGIGRHRPWQGW